MYSMEKQRSRTGCSTCRSRKVKCDERPGGCLNCVRLNLPCPNAPNHGQQHDPVDGSEENQAGLKRSRTYRSCKACRALKTRCSGDRPKCVRCQQRNIGCLYDGKEAPAWVDTTSAELRGPYKRSSAERNVSQVHKLSSNYSHRKQSSNSTPHVPEAHLSADRDGHDCCPKELSWLMSPELPDKDKVIILVQEYFNNMHYLRCFGFIHKPSYLQELHEQPRRVQQENALLYSICALGAKFQAMKSAEYLTLPEEFSVIAGNQWAVKAQALLFMDQNNVSLEKIMALVLLHEHDIRIGNYASAFMLTGLCVRMAQALRINLEISNNAFSSSGEFPWSFQEARRRVMWSVYIMDSWVGNGADELTLIRECDLQIQLPCNESNFNLEIPCIVETLRPGEYLPFVTIEDRAKEPVDVLDLQAEFIRLLRLRQRVLRYVKHLDTALAPWVPGSEFAELQSSLFLWHQKLPSSLQFTQGAIYLRKSSSQLGAFLLLHWMYHQSLCDLNRIGMREPFQAFKAVDFPPEQVDFKTRTQDQCMEHAAAIAVIFNEAARHGSEGFADTWLPFVAYDSTRVIVHFVTHKLGTSKNNFLVIKAQGMPSIQANITALRMMVPMFRLAKPLYAAASNIIREAGFEIAELADVGLALMPRRDIDDKEKSTSERAVPATSVSTEKTKAYLPPAPRTRQPPSGPVAASTTNNVMAPGESWFGSDISHPMSAGDGFLLPSSFDSLQAYFPLMFNDFRLPA